MPAPPPLGASAVILSNTDGSNPTTFDVDPATYDVLNVVKRGSSHLVLDGTQIHQDFGLQKADFALDLTGLISSYTTVQALWNKYRVTGQQYLLTDWYVNQFKVIFAVGENSFHPVYVRGSNASHTYQMRFKVLDILEWFSGSY